MVEPVKVLNQSKRSDIKSAISYSGNAPGIPDSNTLHIHVLICRGSLEFHQKRCPVETETSEVLGLGDFRLQFSKLFGSGLSR